MSSLTFWLVVGPVATFVYTIVAVCRSSMRVRVTSRKKSVFMVGGSLISCVLAIATIVLYESLDEPIFHQSLLQAKWATIICFVAIICWQVHVAIFLNDYCRLICRTNERGESLANTDQPTTIGFGAIAPYAVLSLNIAAAVYALVFVITF